MFITEGNDHTILLHVDDIAKPSGVLTDRELEEELEVSDWFVLIVSCVAIMIGRLILLGSLEPSAEMRVKAY
jgi:hypothetical protein